MESKSPHVQGSQGLATETSGEPAIDLVLRVAPLGMRVGVEKPEVRLLKMKDGGYRVVYAAWGSLHETRFAAADSDGAHEFFARITGQPTKPWQPRKAKPARVGGTAA